MRIAKQQIQSIAEVLQGQQSITEDQQRCLKALFTPQRFKSFNDPRTTYENLYRKYYKVLQDNGVTNLEITRETLNQLREVVDWWTRTVADKSWLMLAGSVGNGKSTMLRAVQQLNNDMIDLSGNTEENRKTYGMRIVSAYDVVEFKVNNESEFNDLCSKSVLAIDDLGCEPAEVMHYGNIYHPVEELLQRRYDKRNSSCLSTIISTNIESGELKTRYGERVLDRLREMCHKIPYNIPSFRK